MRNPLCAFWTLLLPSISFPQINGKGCHHQVLFLFLVSITSLILVIIINIIIVTFIKEANIPKILFIYICCM